MGGGGERGRESASKREKETEGGREGGREREDMERREGRDRRERERVRERRWRVSVRAQTRRAHSCAQVLRAYPNIYPEHTHYKQAHKPERIIVINITYIVIVL